MTFQSLDEAQESCEFEGELADTATADMKTAFEQLQAARASLESERSIWDGSTLGSGAGVAAVVAACLLPEPFSKAVCVAGVIGGGLTVGASEVDRFSDIAAAEAAVEQAELLYEIATREATNAQMKYGSCLWHHVAKPSNAP